MPGKIKLLGLIALIVGATVCSPIRLKADQTTASSRTISSDCDSEDVAYAKWLPFKGQKTGEGWDATQAMVALYAKRAAGTADLETRVALLQKALTYIGFLKEQETLYSQTMDDASTLNSIQNQLDAAKAALQDEQKLDPLVRQQQRDNLQKKENAILLAGHEHLKNRQWDEAETSYTQCEKIDRLRVYAYEGYGDAELGRAAEDGSNPDKYRDWEKPVRIYKLALCGADATALKRIEDKIEHVAQVKKATEEQGAASSKQALALLKRQHPDIDAELEAIMAKVDQLTRETARMNHDGPDGLTKEEIEAFQRRSYAHAQKQAAAVQKMSDLMKIYSQIRGEAALDNKIYKLRRANNYYWLN
jgi:hypothetical protein